MTDEDPSDDRIAQLLERINQMDEILRQQAWRLYHLEKRLGVMPPPRPQEPAARPPRPSPTRPPQTVGPQPPAEAPPPAEPPRPPARDEAKPQQPAPPSVTPPVRPQAPPAPPPQRVTPPPSPQPAPPTVVQPRPRSRGDLEARIGGNWFQRIGVVAFALGVAFFLKYAYDNAWIGKNGALWICIAIGVGFLAGGERLRPRYHNYAYGLTGLGIAILYTCFYAAYGQLQLWHVVPAFIGMVLVTAAASLLAARYNALPIAVLGLIGGFLTPIVLSTGQDNEIGLFSYITLLDLGVLALAYSKQWRSLNYMAFGGTVLMFLGWCDQWYAPEKLWTTISFLTLFFGIFALLAVLYNVINRRPTRWPDLAMVFANALLYFGASYGLLESQYRSQLGLFAVLVSVFYLALGYFTYRRDREDRLLLYTFWGLAILFAVLAVPIQFHQHWITMGWAVEGAILTWIGLRVNDRISRYGALIVFLIAVTHWVAVDLFDFAYRANQAFIPILNRRALSCAVLVAALTLAVSFYKRLGAQVENEERQMFVSLYTLGANVLAVTLLTLDANDYFGQKQALANESGGRLNNDRHLTLSALWSVYGAVALAVGVKRNLKVLRMAALVLLAAAGVKLLLKDLLYYDAAWHRTLFNSTFAAFAIFVCATAAGAWLYARAKDLDPDEKSLGMLALVGAANLFAVIALSAEAIGHFERLKATTADQTIAHSDNMKQFALSAVWIVYGAVSCMIGIHRKRRGLRLASLGLLGLATLKLLAVDLWYYNAAWHTTVFNPTFAAFALLIVALVVVAWFYRRYSAVDDPEREPTLLGLVGAANLLALISLSTEIIGHFKRARAALGGTIIPTEVGHLLNNMLMWLSLLWTVYGAVALIIGIRRNSKWLRTGALGLLVLTTLKTLGRDLRYYDAPWHHLIFNQTFAAFALLIAALTAGVWFYSRAAQVDEPERTNAKTTLVIAANVLAVIALSAEALGYFGAQIAGVGGDFAREHDLRLAQQLWLTVVWAVYGGTLLTVGLLRRQALLRLMALALLALTIVKVYVLDIWSLAKLYRIVALILLGVVLLLVSFLYQPLRRRLAEADNDAGGEAD